MKRISIRSTCAYISITFVNMHDTNSFFKFSEDMVGGYGGVLLLCEICSPTNTLDFDTCGI